LTVSAKIIGGRGEQRYPLGKRTSKAYEGGADYYRITVFSAIKSSPSYTAMVLVV